MAQEDAQFWGHKLNAHSQMQKKHNFCLFCCPCKDFFSHPFSRGSFIFLYFVKNHITSIGVGVKRYSCPIKMFLRGCLTPWFLHHCYWWCFHICCTPKQHACFLFTSFDTYAILACQRHVILPQDIYCKVGVLQACYSATRYCKVSAQKSLNDGNRMEEPGCAAISWVDPLYGACTR